MEKETPEFYKEKDIFGLDKQELDIPESSATEPEEKELDVRYASLGKRIAAYLLDAFILFFPLLIIDSVLFTDTFSRASEGVRVFFDLLVWTFYYGLCESSAQQGTLEKIICGIKVIDEEGNKLSFQRAIARYLATAISIVPLGFGIWAIATDNKAQGWHDRITRCLVVERKTTIEADVLDGPQPGEA